MSQENVEILRRGVTAFARGDVGSLMEFVDPEVEWKPLEESAPVHGPEGVRRASMRWFETWEEDAAAEALEYIDAGDQVVVHMRYRGHGKASGVEVELTTYCVFTLRDGKIVHLHEYAESEREAAFKAAGLRD